MGAILADDDNRMSRPATTSGNPKITNFGYAVNIASPSRWRANAAAKNGTLPFERGSLEQPALDGRSDGRIGGSMQDVPFTRKDWLQAGAIVGGGVAVGATVLLSSVIPLIVMVGGAASVAVLELRKPRA
ncbi:hypothetical protein DBR17_02860 [Sphingomonas sp. HMWF008]|nr:hypothetical protein DBR17_02860 [Sphingomonas sp. HMWF008]